MIPAPFEYAAPMTLDEAVALLKARGDDAKVTTGGQSLIPLLKLRLAQPALLVDLGRIPGLDGIGGDGSGAIAIGALATHAAIARSQFLKDALPLLGEVAGQIGDAQVRNRGTIGGALAHADPAADWPAAALALDGELTLLGPGGRRNVQAGAFFKGLFATDLRAGEVIVEVRFPAPPPGARYAYQKVKQAASGFAIAGVAVALARSDGGTCERAAVGVTGVAVSAYRAGAVEQALCGKRLDAPTIAAAAERAADGVQSPLDDLHASGEYRLHLARVHCKRALARAAAVDLG